MQIEDYERIIVLGNSGSGKSFFARSLAEITGLPLIHLDVEFWRPNWKKTPKDEWIVKQKQMISRDRWIIDGNYNSTLSFRFDAADAVVFLDMNRLMCLLNAIKRHGTKRSDLPHYLEERFDRDFWQFCKLIWGFNKREKKSF